MSGSDGGGVGGGGFDYDLPCDNLRFEAQLTSPQPAVVTTLVVAEVLDIVINTMNDQVVLQVLKNGQVAGGLAGPDATRLRNCIEQDHQYKATVRLVNSGQVRVLIEHA